MQPTHQPVIKLHAQICRLSGGRLMRAVRRICVTDEEECIEYLLSQCPAFAPHWKEHRAPYDHEPTPGGLMLDLAAFGRYAADAIERDAATELAAIALAADRLVDWPSDHVQTAAVYGLEMSRSL